MKFKTSQKIYLFFKRLMDIALSFLLILIFSIPMLILATILLITSGRPILFNQERIGKNEKIFKLHKFRSMVNDAEKLGVYSDNKDKRLTKFGKFLRKTSLDELPQLFNIFVGDMSFIGPRPPLLYHPYTIDKYTEYQKNIFRVRPGMTGWAQINGRRTVEWNKRFELNVWYVKHISFWLDVKIFIKTIFAVFVRKDNENIGASTHLSHLKLMYITNKPHIIKTITKAGIDYVFIDMEYIGKEERQKGLDSVKNHHSINDIKIATRNNKGSSRILVRVNPINQNSKKEIDDSINAGADVVMLPMFKNADEVSNFIGLVNGRAKTCLLLETKEAVKNIDEILTIKGIDQIHIGLNDLHLSYKLKFIFELLSNGVVGMLCQKFKQHNIPYGFGGISHIDGGDVPSQLIIAEHFYLGSSFAILSRGFVNQSLTPIKFKNEFNDELNKIRLFETTLFNKNEDYFIENEKLLYTLINKVSSRK